MYNIRLATHDDVDALAEMGRLFYEEESPYAKVRPYNVEHGKAFAKELIDNHYYLIAESDGIPCGMAASFIATLPVNPDILLASEVVFWVDKNYRGTSLAVRLAMALEDVVLKNEDVDAICMSALAQSPAVVEKLYGRMGYEYTEKAFMKRRV